MVLKVIVNENLFNVFNLGVENGFGGGYEFGAKYKISFIDILYSSVHSFFKILCIVLVLRRVECFVWRGESFINCVDQDIQKWELIIGVEFMSKIEYVDVYKS